MLSYKEVFEIGVKGERLGFWRLAYPVVREGHLGLSVLREQWDFLTVPDLEAAAEVAPIIAKIRQREARAPLTAGL